MGTGVDVLDDGIGFCRIHLGGEVDDAVDIGGAVAPFGDKFGGASDSGIAEGLRVTGLDGRNGLSSFISKNVCGGLGDGAGFIDEESEIGVEGCLVVARAGGEVSETGPIELGSVVVNEVRIARFAVVCGENHFVVGEILDIADDVIAGCDRVRFSGSGVTIEVAPAGALGLENQTFLVGSGPEEEITEMDKCGGFFVYPLRDLSGFKGYFDYFLLLKSTNVELDEDGRGFAVVPCPHWGW